MKKILMSSVLLGLLHVGANETSLEKKVNTIEKGFEFYKGSDSKNKKNNEKKNVLQYLKALLKESKDQTKTQKDILKLLKKTLDPEPRTFTLKDGTLCTSNKSSKCFDYGALLENHPGVKENPVLKRFLTNPYDLKNAAEYVEWQGKLLNHANNVGNAIQFANEQWGNKINPMVLNRSTFNTSSGDANATLIPEIRKKYLVRIKDKMNHYIFLGFNINLDLFAAESIIDVLISNPDLNYTFVFSDKKIEILFSELINTLYSKNIKAWNIATKVVSKEIFEDFDIYTTPSLAIKFKINENYKIQTIATGKISNKIFRSRTFNFLEFNKILNKKQFSDTEYWKGDKGLKIVEKYYKSKFNVEINTEINTKVKEK